jgi:hypothetical protein
LRALTKVRSTERRNRPFVAEAIYLRRPEVFQKTQYHKHLALFVEQYDGFHPEALRPVLDRLRKAREVAAE